MYDLISRQAAIAFVKSIPYIKEHQNMGELIKEWIEQIPAIQPEQKTGRWIEHIDKRDDTYYECSSCKEEFTLIEGTPADNLYNYCPNCGAKMEEVK